MQPRQVEENERLLSGGDSQFVLWRLISEEISKNSPQAAARLIASAATGRQLAITIEQQVSGRLAGPASSSFNSTQMGATSRTGGAIGIPQCTLFEQTTATSFMPQQQPLCLASFDKERQFDLAEMSNTKPSELDSNNDHHQEDNSDRSRSRSRSRGRGRSRSGSRSRSVSSASSSSASGCSRASSKLNQEQESPVASPSNSSQSVQQNPVQQQLASQKKNPVTGNSGSGSGNNNNNGGGGRARLAKQRRLYKCRHCGFETDKKVENWQHIRIHMRPEKLLACDDCQFVTEYKHHLEYHQRNHSGYKPFKCEHCEYQCVNKSMLNSHMKSHSSVYQYQCGDCKYATKYVHSLKMHLRKYNHQPTQLMIDVYGRKRGPKSNSSSSASSTNEQQCILDLRVDSKLI